MNTRSREVFDVDLFMKDTRSYMERHGVSIKQLSEEINISVQSLYDLLNGKTGPDLRSVVSLAKFADIDLNKYIL